VPKNNAGSMKENGNCKKKETTGRNGKHNHRTDKFIKKQRRG